MFVILPEAKNLAKLFSSHKSYYRGMNSHACVDGYLTSEKSPRTMQAWHQQHLESLPRTDLPSFPMPLRPCLDDGPHAWL